MRAYFARELIECKSCGLPAADARTTDESRKAAAEVRRPQTTRRRTRVETSRWVVTAAAAAAAAADDDDDDDDDETDGAAKLFLRVQSCCSCHLAMTDLYQVAAVSSPSLGAGSVAQVFETRACACVHVNCVSGSVQRSSSSSSSVAIRCASAHAACVQPAPVYPGLKLHESRSTAPEWRCIYANSFPAPYSRECWKVFHVTNQHITAICIPHEPLKVVPRGAVWETKYFLTPGELTALPQTL